MRNLIFKHGLLPILIIFMSILHPSTPAVIRSKFKDIRDFQHCLVDYLSTIGIIQFTNLSQNPQKDCQMFHKELNATIETMYRVIKLNLEDVLSNEESSCMVEVFRHTKFMEYNVVATAAVQFQPDGFNELKNLLHISKNIFIYATMKCIITNEMITDLIADLANKINVNEDEFGCITGYAAERKLLKDVIIGDIDVYLSEKLMNVPGYDLGIKISEGDDDGGSNNLELSTIIYDHLKFVESTTLQATTKTDEISQHTIDNNLNDYKNSAESATNSSDTDFSMLDENIQTIASSMEIPPAESEIRGTTDEVELNVNENIKTEVSTSGSDVLLDYDKVSEQTRNDLDENPGIADFSSTDSAYEQITTDIPQIISTMLKKVSKPILDEDPEYLESREAKLPLIFETTQKYDQNSEYSDENEKSHEKKTKNAENYNFMTKNSLEVPETIKNYDFFTETPEAKSIDIFEDPNDLKSAITEDSYGSTTASGILSHLDENFEGSTQEPEDLSIKSQSQFNFDKNYQDLESSKEDGLKTASSDENDQIYENTSEDSKVLVSSEEIKNIPVSSEEIQSNFEENSQVPVSSEENFKVKHNSEEILIVPVDSQENSNILLNSDKNVKIQPDSEENPQISTPKSSTFADKFKNLAKSLQTNTKITESSTQTFTESDAKYFTEFYATSTIIPEEVAEKSEDIEKVIMERYHEMIENGTEDDFVEETSTTSVNSEAENSNIYEYYENFEQKSTTDENESNKDDDEDGNGSSEVETDDSKANKEDYDGVDDENDEHSENGSGELKNVEIEDEITTKFEENDIEDIKSSEIEPKITKSSETEDEAINLPKINHETIEATKIDSKSTNYENYNEINQENIKESTNNPISENDDTKIDDYDELAADLLKLNTEPTAYDESREKSTKTSDLPALNDYKTFEIESLTESNQISEGMQDCYASDQSLEKQDETSSEKSRNLNKMPETLTESSQNLMEVENPEDQEEKVEDSSSKPTKSSSSRLAFKIFGNSEDFSKLTLKSLENAHKVSEMDENLKSSDNFDENVQIPTSSAENLPIITSTNENSHTGDENIENSASFKGYLPVPTSSTEKLQIPASSAENKQNLDSHASNPHSLASFIEKSQISKKSDENLQNSDSLDEIPTSSAENQQTLSNLNQNPSNSIQNIFKKLAKSLKKSPKPSNSELDIPDSRIKRYIPATSLNSCNSIIENLKLRFKKYNFESMDDVLNHCMGQHVSPADIDDFFVFIVLKKYGSEKLENEKNKKLMNLIVSFIGRFIECTDLYGFVEMAGLPIGGGY